MDAKKPEEQKSNCADPPVLPPSQRGLISHLQIIESTKNVPTPNDPDGKHPKRFVSCEKILVPERFNFHDKSRASASALNVCERTAAPGTEEPAPRESAKDCTQDPIPQRVLDPNLISAFRVQVSSESADPEKKPPSSVLIFSGLLTSIALIVKRVIYLAE